jgi:hypothetical protein
MGAGQPAFRSVGFPTAVVVLAFLPVLSRLGIDLSRKTAVVMVIVVVVVTVVVVGVLGLLVVPMLLCRVDGVLVEESLPRKKYDAAE